MKKDFNLIYLLPSLMCLFLSCKSGEELRPMTTLDSIEPYQDVRWCDISKLNHPIDEPFIETLTFSPTTTIWSSEHKKIAQNILELGKNPGLGVYELHRRGIVGKGVNVAIIDQNLVFDNSEYLNNIVEYRDFGCNQTAGSMHGPAVLSLLSGEETGTAPEANIYFAAIPTWKGDAKYFADALNWILDFNEILPQDEQIRAISISSAPSSSKMFPKNQKLWKAAFNRAMEQDILIIDCSAETCITAACYLDIRDPENFENITIGFNGMEPIHFPGTLYIPTSKRTTSEHYYPGKYTFQYTGVGGLSWAEPYLVGVLALGWQIRPELSGEKMVNIIFDTAYVDKSGNKIINPDNFIRTLEASNNTP